MTLTIRQEVEALRVARQALNESIEILQAKCPHPGKHECYFIDITKFMGWACDDCGKCLGHFTVEEHVAYTARIRAEHYEAIKLEAGKEMADAFAADAGLPIATAKKDRPKPKIDKPTEISQRRTRK